MSNLAPIDTTADQSAGISAPLQDGDAAFTQAVQEMTTTKPAPASAPAPQHTAMQPVSGAMSWVPPEYSLSGTGDLNFSRPFDLKDYYGRLQPHEQAAVKAGGVSALAQIIDRDRSNYQKLAAKADPLSDFGYYQWLDDRGLLPEVKGPGVLASLGKMAKDLWQGTKQIAETVDKDIIARQIGTEDDQAQTRREGGAVLLATGKSIRDNYSGLAAGAKKLLIDKVTNKFEQNPELARYTKQLAAFDFARYATQSAEEQKAFYDDLSSLVGMDSEKLQQAGSAGSFVADPVNIAGAAAGASGKLVSTFLPKTGAASLPGITKGLAAEALANKAEMATVQATIKTMTEAGAHFGEATDELAQLFEREKVLTQKLANADALKSAAIAEDIANLNATFGPGVARQAAGKSVSGVGQALDALGRGAQWVEELPARGLESLAGGDAETRKVLMHVGSRVSVGGAAGYVMAGEHDGAEGAILGAAIAATAPTALRWSGKNLKAIGELYALGETTLPFARKMRQEAMSAGLTARLAELIDPVTPFTRAAGKTVKAGAHGAVAGGVLGYVGSGGEGDGTLEGAAQGFVMGGLFGTFFPVKTEADQMSLLTNERNYLLRRWGPESQNAINFNKLTPEHQLSLAHLIHANPDHEFRVGRTGEKVFGGGHEVEVQGDGFHYVGEDGHSVIVVNSDGTSPFLPVVSHELIHDAQVRGTADDLVTAIVGNQEAGIQGIHTKIGPDGQWGTTESFRQAKEDYIARYRRATGDTGREFTDRDIALELAAEEGASMLMKPGFIDEQIRPTMGGIFSDRVAQVPFLKKLLGNMGVAFDLQGEVKGALGLRGAKHSPEVQKVLKEYMKQWGRGDKIAIDPEAETPGLSLSREIVVRDPDVLHLFDQSGVVNWNEKTGLPEGMAIGKDGKPVIVDEKKIFKSAKQLAAENAAMADAVAKAVDESQAPAASEDVVKLRTNADGKQVYAGRYLSDEAIAKIEKSGKFNPYQVEAIKNLNELLKSGTGQHTRFFYQPATSHRGSKIYKSLAGHWREEVPYGWEITKADNIVFRTVSYDYLAKNLNKEWARHGSGAQEIWPSAAQMLQDAKLYLSNLAEFKPGEEGLGVAKKNFLNSAIGLETTGREDVNPLYRRNAKLDTIITSRRFDRTNRITPAPRENIPWSHEAYRRAKLNLAPGKSDEKPLEGSLGKGEMKLVHFSSNRALKETDPKFMGKGHATPSDFRGSNVTFFFEQGSKYGQDSKVVATPDKQVYGATVPKGKIYDLGRDKLNLDQVNLWKRDEAIKKAGFIGYSWERNDGAKGVALFNKQGVQPLDSAKQRFSPRGDVTQSPEFQKWFNGSVVKDDEGKPLKVFHGSRSEEPITKFNTEHGTYFTTDREYAEGFRDVARDFGAKDPKMYEVYLDIKNPKIFDGEDLKQFEAFTGSRTPSAKLIKEGYDGEVLQFANGHRDFRVVRPNQIKSATENKGTFDSKNPDIRFSPGSSGIFVSPNTGELDYPGAKRALEEEGHASFRSVAEKLAGEGAKISDAVGDWADGAENSLHISLDKKAPEEVQRLAAQLGLEGKQKAVLHYMEDPNGKDLLHEITFPGMSIDDARQATINAGIENRTIVGTPEGAKVILFDQGAGLKDKVDKLLSYGSEASHSVQKVTGDFLGSWDSREAGLARYREVLGLGAEDVPEGNHQGEPGQVGDSSVRSGEVADIGDRISTRTPSAVASTEDPIKEQLAIGADHVLRDYDTKRTIAQLIKKYPNTPKDLKKPGDIISHFQKQAVENLLWLHDSVDPEIRERSKLWYDGGRKLVESFSEEHGVSRPAAAGVMAALSPQKDWFMNVDLARRVITEHKLLKDAELPEAVVDWFRGKFGDKLPKVQAYLEGAVGEKFSSLNRQAQAIFLRAHDEMANPRGYQIITPEGSFAGPATNADGKASRVAWGDFNTIAKAISILADPRRENISAQLGGEHKVRNFYNNLLLPNNAEHGDVTIDTHAVAAATLRPLAGGDIPVMHNFGGGGAPGSSVVGASGTYGLYADAYREAAKQRGILPREMQSITWEAIRGLFPAEFKTEANKAAVDAIWKQYKDGKLSLNAVRSQILEVAGGIDRPAWSVSSP